MRKLLIVLGVPVDNLTMAEALDRCVLYLEQYEYQPLHPVREHLRGHRAVTTLARV